MIKLYALPTVDTRLVLEICGDSVFRTIDKFGIKPDDPRAQLLMMEACYIFHPCDTLLCTLKALRVSPSAYYLILYTDNKNLTTSRTGDSRLVPISLAAAVDFCRKYCNEESEPEDWRDATELFVYLRLLNFDFLLSDYDVAKEWGLLTIKKKLQ